MTAERTLIASVVLLALGLGFIFGYTHGTVGFSAAYPISGASLQVMINTTGTAAMAGFAATALGALLLIVAFILAIVREVSPAEIAK